MVTEVTTAISVMTTAGAADQIEGALQEVPEDSVEVLRARDRVQRDDTMIYLIQHLVSAYLSVVFMLFLW